MNYTLAIADVVELHLKAAVNDGGQDRTFAFHLRAKRMPQQALRDALADKDLTVKDFLREKITGWRGQRLVLGEDGEPAPFGPEALDCMLSVVGMETLVLNAYLKAMGAEAVERAKN